MRLQKKESDIFSYEEWCKAMIELKNVSKTFVEGHSQIEAVKDVSLTIENKEIFGIIGFSGAGKSTLVRCINLLESPTSGQIMIDGLEMTALKGKTLREARKKIGMIFQHFNLFPSRTIFENVAYPLGDSRFSKQEIEDKVNHLLELVGIADKARFYPSQLSGGQKQRVAIARALATNPSILLCDEATSALDPKTTRSILKLLKELNKKLDLTIVLITHEMEVVREICNRVAIMDKGQLIEESDIFSLFSNPKQSLTKSFIKTTSNLHKIEQLVEEGLPLLNLGNNELVVRLTYLEKTVSEPLISKFSKHFDVDFNIIFADVEMIQGSPIGGTVAILSGEERQLELVLTALEKERVRVEVIKDGRKFG